MNWLQTSKANPFYVNKFLLEKLPIPPDMNTAYTNMNLYVHIFLH